jgi:SSS family solute:Na+ symporter
MDVYKRLLKPDASERSTVRVSRGSTLVAIVIGCLVAPMLADPRFGGVFQFIQQFQGYIWPGVVAAFVFGLLVPQAPGMAGVAALLAGPIIYFLFQRFAPGIHFLIQVALTFQLVLALMGLLTFLRPLATPRTMPERAGLDLRTEPVVLWAGGAVVAAVIAFFIVFR